MKNFRNFSRKDAKHAKEFGKCVAWGEQREPQQPWPGSRIAFRGSFLTPVCLIQGFLGVPGVFAREI
jgi:hypothetical protein